MIAELKGTVVSVKEAKTQKGKSYRAVQLLQQGEKGADLVRVRLWNGTKIEEGKSVSLTVVVEAFVGSRGGALLSADVY